MVCWGCSKGPDVHFFFFRRVRKKVKMSTLLKRARPGTIFQYIFSINSQVCQTRENRASAPFVINTIFRIYWGCCKFISRAQLWTSSSNSKSILKNKDNPTTYQFYFFHICTILSNMNAEREETCKFEIKLEVLTGSWSQIELYLEKYAIY